MNSWIRVNVYTILNVRHKSQLIMAINYVPLLADLLLYSYVSDFIQGFLFFLLCCLSYFILQLLVNSLMPLKNVDIVKKSLRIPKG
jgi:hypothetical protein